MSESLKLGSVRLKAPSEPDPYRVVCCRLLRLRQPFLGARSAGAAACMHFVGLWIGKQTRHTIVSDNSAPENLDSILVFLLSKVFRVFIRTLALYKSVYTYMCRPPSSLPNAAAARG